MATFAVNTDSLAALHDQLVGVNQELLGTRTTVSGYEGRLGGRMLDHAMEDFCGHWDNGLNILQTHMQNVLQRLTDAIQAYDQAEGDISNAMPADEGA